MSVRKGDRGEGKLQVLNKARELKKYTLGLIKMEQVKAHAHLDALLDLADDAYDAGYISGNQVEYWTGLILKTDDLLKAWIKSDKEKYQK